MALRLYDSATRSVRDFVPRTPGRASIYVCGLTVQSAPHVGHVRSAVSFDVLRRWLLASDCEVDFVRNITDIDDKILARAAEQDRPWYALASEVARELTRTYDALRVLPPTYEPLASGHVPEMLELIAELVERGHAYPAPADSSGSGDVYFDVRSWPAYGELTHQALDDMEAAPDADPRGKRDPRDFALWKGHKEGEPLTASWPSPWGRGRPGWHVECSAMAGKYLGDAFDVHGGGVDLRFPHHENEQAQSRAAGRDFAAYWLHNAWITTAGEKMSKSLGNALLVPAVLERVRGVELRYYMVASHYRSTVEFSFEALEEAAQAYRRVEGFLERVAVDPTDPPTDPPGELPPAFVAAMDDDLGTPAAVAVLHETVRAGNKRLAAGEDASEQAELVTGMLHVLGLQREPSGADGDLHAVVDALVRGLLESRARAREAKDFATADALRDQVEAAGVEVEDTPTGPTWTIASTR